jgi:hypothetical protein
MGTMVQKFVPQRGVPPSGCGEPTAPIYFRYFRGMRFFNSASTPRREQSDSPSRKHSCCHERKKMPVLVKTVLLLITSNVFMTFAWYAHLKELSAKPWYIAALISWGVAFFEYLFQVPANRIGHTQFNVGQLKIIQEVITLSVFVPFSFFYLREPLKLDYLWAGVCLCGAVYFVFRNGLAAG